MRWLAAVLALALGAPGCDPEGTHFCKGDGVNGDFPDGWYCPKGYACSSEPLYCGKPDPNVAPCSTLKPQAACTTVDGAVGVCLNNSSGMLTCTTCTQEIGWCRYGGWNQLHIPPPFDGLSFASVWVGDAGNVYVGVKSVPTNNGTALLHYDGVNWAAAPTFPSAAQGTTISSLWGSSAQDIYALAVNSELFHFDGSAWSPTTSALHLASIWGPGPGSTRLVAAGSFGEVAEFDGSNFVMKQSMMVNVMGTNYAPIFSGSWTDGTVAYAVGGANSNAAGAFAYFDGSSWSAIAPAAPNNEQLVGVWGSDSTNVVAVGFTGQTTATLLKLSGTTYSIAPNTQSLPGINLAAVWGSGANDVYVAGHSGTLFHYDGTGWTSQGPLGAYDLNAVHGSGAADVFAVGNNGEIWHYTSAR